MPRAPQAAICLAVPVLAATSPAKPSTAMPWPISTTVNCSSFSLSQAWAAPSTALDLLHADVEQPHARPLDVPDRAAMAAPISANSAS